jgi:glycosyltransferase involved in cell wall biosynthesis
MRILNIMLAKTLGGIEQVFLDYDHALRSQKEDVISVVNPKALIKNQLSNDSKYLELSDFSQFDWFAAIKLRKIIKTNKIDAIITHGNRATVIAQKACLKKTPIISVAHNYHIKHLLKSDSIIAITEDLKNKIIETGFPKNKVFKLNNPIILEESTIGKFKKFANIPTIGFIGRFVPRKGINVLVDAIKKLQERNIKVKAIFASDGPEKERIVQQVKSLGLEKIIKFVGWIEDKKAFFNSIDIFIIPSLHEAFGVVVLEGLAYSKPIIATKSEGPSEILHNNVDGILVEINSSDEIANAIEYLIDNPEKAKKIAMNGHKEVKKYDIVKFSKNLQKIIKEVVN